MSISEKDKPFHIHSHYDYPLEIACTIPRRDYLKIAINFFLHLAPRTSVLYILGLVPISLGIATLALQIIFRRSEPLSFESFFGTVVVALFFAFLYFIYIVTQLKLFGHTNSPKGLKRTYYFDKTKIVIFENKKITEIDGLSCIRNIFEKGEYIYFAAYEFEEHLLFCIPTRRLPHDFYLFLTEDEAWEKNHPFIEFQH